MAPDLRELSVVYLKGVAMGTADAVPGVSGGTIALITGIYERLIGALTAIDPERVLAVLAGVRPERRDGALEALAAMDVPFLGSLGVGVLTAIVLVTAAVEHALAVAPLPTFGFFFGLIAASAYVLRSSVSLDRWTRVVAAVAGLTFAFVVSGQAAAGLGHSTPVIFVAGLIAVSAMILPGISGSFILLVLGQYEYMIGALGAFRTALVAVLSGERPAAALVAPGTTVTTFVVGAVIGLFTLAHAVGWALERYRKATLAFLVSLIVGALRAPVVKMDEALAESGRVWTPELLGVVFVAALVGGILVVVLEGSVEDVRY
jgi:putative membrane protein